MVNILIFIEGSILPHKNHSEETMNNSAKWRESFHDLFSQLLPSEKFNLIIKPEGSNKQTIKSFKEKENSFLLIDLDNPKKERERVLENFGLLSNKKNVFFMIQEMEAWILSQIDKIDELYKNKYIRKKANIKLSEDESIKNKKIEEIEKPSEKLKILLGRYFSHKTKKSRNKKYSKLKDGADFIAILEADELYNYFEDFENLINTAKSNSR